MLEEDAAEVFLNPEEFADHHLVEGRRVRAVLDGSSSAPNLESVGIAQADMTLYARPEELPAKRPPGSKIEVDGRVWLIQSWSEDGGVSSVSLIQNIT